MGDKGGLGIRLDLDRVPVREAGMTAYEMMLSESQERMLMVLRPEREAEAKAIFDKWDLDFAIVGETIPEDRFLILHGNQVKADLPLSKLSSSAPEYDRPFVETPPAPPLAPVPQVDPVASALRRADIRVDHVWDCGLGDGGAHLSRLGFAAENVACTFACERHIQEQLAMVLQLFVNTDSDSPLRIFFLSRRGCIRSVATAFIVQLALKDPFGKQQGRCINRAGR
jgi:hypothetical protein